MSAGEEGSTDRQDASVAAVLGTDALVDSLGRREVPGTGAADPVALLLVGWVRVIDGEVDVATAAPTRSVSGGSPVARTAAAGVPEGTGPEGTGLAQAGATGSRGTGVVAGWRARTPRRARAPWWVVPAAAATMMAVLAVGVGWQQGAPAVVETAEATTEESFEATLVAALLAAEAGDVSQARVLLERAGLLLSSLPAEERGRWEEAMDAAERGLVSAEDAVRGDTSLPQLLDDDLPVGAVRSLLGARPDVAGTRAAAPGAVPGSDARGRYPAPATPATPTTGAALTTTTATGTAATPTEAAPVTATPTTAGPTSATPTTARPTSATPTTAGPTSTRPASTRPATAGPPSARPATARPATARPTGARPTTEAPRGRPTAGPGARPSTGRPTATPNGPATVVPPAPATTPPSTSADPDPVPTRAGTGRPSDRGTPPRATPSGGPDERSPTTAPTTPRGTADQGRQERGDRGQGQP